MTEQPKCFKSVTRKAAKQHKCCECDKKFYVDVDYEPNYRTSKSEER